MKPLAEWTEQELRSAIACREPAPWSLLDRCMDELVRRAEVAMKERCAAVCDSVAADMMTVGENRPALVAGVCAARIRELT